MRRTNNEFTSIVHAALAATPVHDLLGAKDAVVLERLARGGGATNWYYCRGKAKLQAIEEELSPGSVVSFYFDGRIGRSLFSAEIRADIERIVAETTDAIVGILREDGMHIDATMVLSPQDLAEFTSALGPSSELLYGAFPGRDNDGARAVTVTLPDDDGIVRPHPH